jgi:hypothetical protein
MRLNTCRHTARERERERERARERMRERERERKRGVTYGSEPVSSSRIQTYGERKGSGWGGGGGKRDRERARAGKVVAARSATACRSLSATQILERERARESGKW